MQPAYFVYRGTSRRCRRSIAALMLSPMIRCPLHRPRGQYGCCFFDLHQRQYRLPSICSSTTYDEHWQPTQKVLSSVIACSFSCSAVAVSLQPSLPVLRPNAMLTADDNHGSHALRNQFHQAPPSPKTRSARYKVSCKSPMFLRAADFQPAAHSTF